MTKPHRQLTPAMHTAAAATAHHVTLPLPLAMTLRQRLAAADHAWVAAHYRQGNPVLDQAMLALTATATCVVAGQTQYYHALFLPLTVLSPAPLLAPDLPLRDIAALWMPCLHGTTGMQLALPSQLCSAHALCQLTPLDWQALAQQRLHSPDNPDRAVEGLTLDLLQDAQPDAQGYRITACLALWLRTSASQLHSSWGQAQQQALQHRLTAYWRQRDPAQKTLRVIVDYPQSAVTLRARLSQHLACVTLARLRQQSPHRHATVQFHGLTPERDYFFVITCNDTPFATLTLDPLALPAVRRDATVLAQPGGLRWDWQLPTWH